MSDVIEGGIEFTPEEQAAAARLDTPEDDGGLPDGYQADGTPKEELILGKFKTAEDLQKAYTELEKKLGAPKEHEVPKTTEAPKETEVPKEIEGLIKPSDFTSFSEEYNTNGTLSEETYKSLEKKGLSKDVVDAYIDGQKALAENKANKLLNYVGGTEKYNTIVEWARGNYTPEQAKSFDEALFSGDEARVQEQVDLLSFRMTKQTGQPQRRLEGTSTDVGGGLKPFESKSDWQRAMADRNYGRDMKYTRMVDSRYLKAIDAGIL